MRGVATYCGPAAVASALGITRDEAAERLLAVRPTSRGRFHWWHLAEVLFGRPMTKKNNTPREGIIRYTHKPTLAGWLREDARDAIVFVGGHFVHVRGGVVVEDNGWPMRRGRVWVAILLRGAS